MKHVGLLDVYTTITHTFNFVQCLFESFRKNAVTYLNTFKLIEILDMCMPTNTDLIFSKFCVVLVVTSDGLNWLSAE